MYRRSLLSLCSVPAIILATAPAALAGETTTVTVTEPAPPPPPAVTVTEPAPPAPPPPPAVTVTVPAPPAAPAPATPRHKNGGDTNSGSGGDTSSPAAPVTATPVAHTVSLESTAARTPVGGVQAGGGGTAPVPGGPDWLGLGLAGGVLVLVGGGWELLLRARSHRP